MAITDASWPEMFLEVHHHDKITFHTYCLIIFLQLPPLLLQKIYWKVLVMLHVFYFQVTPFRAIIFYFSITKGSGGWSLSLVFYIFVNNRDCIFLTPFLNLFYLKSENFCSISQTFAEKSPPGLHSLHSEVHPSANRHYSFLPSEVKLPKTGSTQQP